MKYKKLGTSDLQISEISFGCMSLEDDHEANAKLLHTAFEKGINYFDTADIYQRGFNEETVGRAFKAMRSKVILATKVGNQPRSDGRGLDWNASRKYILQAVEKSLSRLQTDYIDLYQLHGGTLDDPIDETIEAFELLRQQGKIRYYGISSIRPNVIRQYITRSNIVSVMMQYSLLDRRPEEECLSLLDQNSIGVVTRGSIAKGLLVSKPAEPYLNYTAEQVSTAAEAVTSVSGASRSKTATALQFVLQHAAVTSAVVGIRTPEQLEENIRAAAAPQLTQNEIDLLRNSIPVNKYDQHR
ncbi:aldo/keto reductase [Ohtaekwangia koreensis]|uniref:Predicted oxidoreductase n=1 Tax=Ohtaekwangia koreensis TaxID=688867 RepID=A0A1T5KGT6_9BACT|nr:aldo/keto reductase [Ohtaekwangia koreensis]SKC62578.1 Predicted oxidoreductase [Ohtaekwangia koreensis]